MSAHEKELAELIGMSRQEEDADKATSWGVYGSFMAFLERMMGKPTAVKYAQFLDVRSKLGLDRIREIGLAACVKSLKKVPQPRSKPGMHERHAQLLGSENEALRGEVARLRVALEKSRGEP